MPTLFLHAGAPKTGTSYLQVLFAKHADQLSERGIVYPRGHMFEEARAGQITSGNGVEMANYIRPQLPHQIANKSAFIDELAAQLSTSGSKHVLYSSEFLFFDPGERTASIAKMAADHGYDIRVLYLVRDIAPAAFSVYSQQIKNHGEIRCFAEFIKDWDPHYRSSIQKAVDCFGLHAVEVYNFEEHSERLAALFFGDILNAGFVPEERNRINRSLSSRETEMVRLMNTAYPGNAKFAAFVGSALMGIETAAEPLVITRSEADLLGRRFSKAVEFVNGFVRGQSTKIAGTVVESKRSPELTDFERSMMAIVAKLVAATVK